MSQLKVLSWTNPAAGTAARNESIGFEISEILVSNVTAGTQFYWNSAMVDGSFFRVSTGAYTAINGFTPLAQNTSIGPTISGFTNANPGVITVDETAKYGFAAGDTIKVAELADNLTGTNSLNGNFTVASVTTTTITLVEDTSAPGYSVYVSGGSVTRVSDAAGDPVPIENFAIRGLIIGTGVVGANNDVVTAVVRGENPVV